MLMGLGRNVLLVVAVAGFALGVTGVLIVALPLALAVLGSLLLRDRRYLREAATVALLSLAVLFVVVVMALGLVVVGPWLIFRLGRAALARGPRTEPPADPPGGTLVRAASVRARPMATRPLALAAAAP
jgi:hypothetical protein